MSLEPVLGLVTVSWGFATAAAPIAPAAAASTPPSAALVVALGRGALLFMLRMAESRGFLLFG